MSLCSPPNPPPRTQALLAFRAGMDALENSRPRDGMNELYRAVELSPCAKYHANLAVAMERVAVELETDPIRRRELLERAVVECLGSLHIRPRFIDAAANLSLILGRLGRIHESLYWASLVTSWAPRSAEAAWSRGELLTRQQQHSEAAYWYGRARQLKPSLEVALHNEVGSLSAAGRDTEAMFLLYKNLQLKPADPLIWNNLGCIYRRLGRNQLALDCYERAIQILPESAPAQWGRSLSLLALGRMQDGWEAYEWGLKTGDRKPPGRFPQPRWDGRSLNGMILLVWMEQGLGDHIVWASLLDDLQSCVKTAMLVECEHRLVSLLQRSFPALHFVSQSDPPQPDTANPDIAYQIPAGSLPRLLRSTLYSYRRTGAYLKPDPGRAAEWSRRLSSLPPGHNIGISWRSFRTGGVRDMDCMRLSQWGPLLSIPGINWINLQPGWHQEEMDEVGNLFDAHIHTWSDLDITNDIDEQAALISRLDLVVSAFTVTAQLAGALNVPCWALSHWGNQSWWNLGYPFSPWHPSLRFFQCKALEPWEIAIESLSAKLREWEFMKRSTKPPFPS